MQTLTLTQTIILAVIQGMAELLPVSSSAHVIAAARLMGFKDTSSVQFTLMLVMLHTGTMFAVIVYFWRAWKLVFFASLEIFVRFATKIVIATAVTGVVGFGLVKGIEKYMDPGFSVLTSQSVSEIGHADSRPVASTLLTHVVATDTPAKPLFAVGDKLYLAAIRGDEKQPVRTYTVIPGSTIGDLLGFFERSFGVKSAAPVRAKMPATGGTIKPDPLSAGGVELAMTGSVGSENRLTIAGDAVINQKGRAPLLFVDANKAEVEELFKHLELLAIALAAAGVLILVSGIRSRYQTATPRKGISTGDSISIGAIQGLCLPFRGFSRSGATISVGLLRGVARMRLEEFSFALAVVLTPVAIVKEALRLVSHHGQTSRAPLGMHEFMPSLLGMVFSFVAGLIALKVLSKLLEKGQWWIFGVYCLCASGGIYWMYLNHF